MASHPDRPVTRVRIRRFFLPAIVALAGLTAWYSISWVGSSHVREPSIPGATIERIGSSDVSGVVVTSVRSDGAASAAGLRVGDRIDRINGFPAPTTLAARRDIAHASSRTLNIEVWRSGRIREIRMDRAKGG